MIVRIVFIVTLILPLRVIAWDDDAVLSFISRVNPILQAQRNVTQAYAQPDAVTWALQNTSLSGRLGYGGTDFRDDPYTVFGGLQINIPLSSIKEEREQALKLVAEAKALDNMHTKVIRDIAQLRTLESELDELWSIGSKVNAEDALIAKVAVLAKTQRYKLARHAGSQTLGGYDG